MSGDKKVPVFVTIDALRPDSRGINAHVKVVDARVVLSRPRGPKGQPLRVAECIVGDHTGVIVLTARNDQVDLAQPGAYITLRNAKIDMFRGSMRLAVDQWGKVEFASGLDFVPKTDNNLSLIEYELVTLPDTAAAPA